MDQERLAVLETQVVDLTKRLERLEAQTDVSEESMDFTALQTLQKRRGELFERGIVRGSVFFAGAFFRGHERTIWQVERPAPALMEIDGTALVPIFAALGNSHRLAIVRLLLESSATAQQLQEQLDISSIGQLYHHLKELRAAGLIGQHTRGEYHLIPQAIIPVLTLLAAAWDISNQA